MWPHAVGTLPVDAPSVAGYGYPNKSFPWGASRMVIKRGRSFIESPGVPGIRESLKVQVVTELVTQSAQEGSEGGDLFAYRRFHPHTDKNGVRMIVTKKFAGRSLPDAEGSGGQDPHVAALHLIEVGCLIEKLS